MTKEAYVAKKGKKLMKEISAKMSFLLKNKGSSVTFNHFMKKKDNA